MNKRLAKPFRQLRKLEAAWEAVVPAELREHTALEGFDRGTLKVLVDSASHRFHLEMLLRDGLLKQLRQQSAAPLDRVRLAPGQFYDLDPETGDRRYAFTGRSPSA